MSLADLNQPELSRSQVFLKQSANIYTMLLILSFLAVAIGYARVQRLKTEMTEGRRSRLVKLGFTPDAALALSERHTRNFM